MESTLLEDPLLQRMTKLMMPEARQEPMDLLSNAWCNSAIQVLQPTVDDCSFMFKNNQAAVFPIADRTPSPAKEEMSLRVDEGDFKINPHLKMDDLKSWIWLQQAIHPELDYDLYTKKKWFSVKFPSWNRDTIKKWFKEFKHKRKEKERLKKAEVHAAISVAGVAAALAAIAAESTEGKQENPLKETAVASAAALVAAQCAQVAQAVGANRDQLSSAINEAVIAIDTNNIITLTAAAATSLRGAATLKGRPSRKEKKGNTPILLSNEFEFDYVRCRASLANGLEMLVATGDGQCRLRTVSVTLNENAEVILRIKKKKKSVLTTFSGAKESIIQELRTNPDEPVQDGDGFYCIDMNTSQGKIKFKIDDYMRYKEWITTMNHMLMLSITFSRLESQFSGF